MDAIQQGIVNLEKTMVKLFNQGNIDPILDFFDDSFVGFSSTKHQRINKRSQLKKTFQYYLKEGESLKQSISNIKVNIYGEAALATFYWKVEIKNKGKVKNINGRGSHIFLLKGNVWKIVHEHFSKAH